MLVLESNDYIALFIGKKEMCKMTFKLLKEDLRDNIKSYLIGSNKSSKIIKILIRKKKVRSLYKNIKDYINKKNYDLKPEFVIQEFCDEEVLMHEVLKIKKLRSFLKTIPTCKMFEVLKMRGFMSLDINNKLIYNILKEKPKCYLKWKGIPVI